MYNVCIILQNEFGSLNGKLDLPFIIASAKYENAVA